MDVTAGTVYGSAMRGVVVYAIATLTLVVAAPALPHCPNDEMPIVNDVFPVSEFPAE